MIETSRQNINLPVLKITNNYIFHDRLNFKRSNVLLTRDKRHEIYDVTCCRHLRVIQRRCYISSHVGYPNKQTLSQRWLDVGPPSTTLVQH